MFNEVVLLAPPKQFSASDVFLLTTFVQVTTLLEDAAKAASKANDETRVQKVKALAELAKLQGSLASKLRLAPQSRTNQLNTTRQHKRTGRARMTCSRRKRDGPPTNAVEQD